MSFVYLFAIGANLFAPFSSSISRACARFACVRVDSRNILNFLNLFVYNANCTYLCRNCDIICVRKLNGFYLVLYWLLLLGLFGSLL